MITVVPRRLARHATSDDGIDDVIARVAARLRPIRGSLPPAELDALAHDIVLDVARFVLRWAEGTTAASADQPGELNRPSGVRA